MSHASLAARYRPQTFADVTGQDTVKAILSRAAAEDRVAPAYLLSGTRGVGKTTIARIFAKALNCANAPAAEPCNACEACRRITQGSHVDVVEIDGASNRGIDDARRLREAIGYAPMEGRYKVFIIDEAHMLTRDAFNALLKTLEEPPARATFILATTEPHKFPITIVSRCQHFIFKALPEADLFGHLQRVLDREQLGYEPTAVRLIARRAAGSVRDSMSLLGQTLALGGELTEEAVRSVLGLAGQELYERLLQAFRAQDCVAVAGLTRELLDRGVDLGFFLRELAQLWRNLFLLRQAGESALAALDMPEAEQRRLLALAPGFDLTTIHAAWQMVLESQRQVLTSLEPAAALELLLLNIALLPRLVGMDLLSRARTVQGTADTSPAGTAVSVAHTAATPCTVVPVAPPVSPVVSALTTPPEVRTQPAAAETSQGTRAYVQEPASVQARPTPPLAEATPQVTEPCSWQGFMTFCEAHSKEGDPMPFSLLVHTRGEYTEEGIVLQAGSQVQYDLLSVPARLEHLRGLAQRYTGRTIALTVAPPQRTLRTETELKQELAEHDAVKTLTTHFDATLLRCTASKPVL